MATTNILSLGKVSSSRDLYNGAPWSGAHKGDSLPADKVNGTNGTKGVEGH